MTEIMPVPRNLILLSYQQRASGLNFQAEAPHLLTKNLDIAILWKRHLWKIILDFAL